MTSKISWRARKFFLALQLTSLLALPTFAQAPQSKRLVGHYCNVGHKFAESGDYNAAIANFSRALTIDPDDITSRKERAASYLGVGRNADALADYDKLIALKPDVERYYQERALTNEKLHRLDKALLDYDQIIRLNPTRDTPHYRKAALYETLHDYSRAVAEYSLVIARNPKDDEAYTKRGHANFLRADYKSALKDLTEAIKLDPGYAARAYAERSKVYEKLGKIDLAEQDSKKAKSLNASDQ
ncbi:MAG: tetratricopeptide repeat protein [Cyanobacteria bacterium SZAS TMP-1]|nr:tetratricopeptide repeat protein [Cyanobacteria bacterium SZAS TMP-1]